MGVPGLWDILRPAGQQRSLTHLAVVDGFEANPAGRRGLRIGIDASIWFYHAAYGKEGENPELRTLFFRCARLMSRPFLPLFVFDGPKRPAVKRGKRISGKHHWLTTGMQKIIEAFGFEWKMAPGEAEAELAYLNRIGVIDAIVSDDVDNFLFGAVKVIRNPSKTLSGNRGHPIKNSAGKEDDEHVTTYTASDFIAREDIGVTAGGLILIGLLRGGDYHTEGLPGCGPTIAHALAKCGFGDTLLEAAHTHTRSSLPAFLVAWRHALRHELRTNARGHLPTRRARLADALPEDFPDIDVLLSYTHPVTSESEGQRVPDYRWAREPDLGKLAGICELYFEWGVKEVIIKRFRTVIWAPAVLRILRHAVLDVEASGAEGRVPSTPTKKGRGGRAPPGTPSAMIAKHFSSLGLQSPTRGRPVSSGSDEDDDDERLIVRIHSKRTHATTDGILEYRLEVAPAQLVRLTEAGVIGLRTLLDEGNMSEVDRDEDADECDDDDEAGGRKKREKKPPPDPNSHLRVWMPACMVRLVEPELVEEFEATQEQKRLKKANGAARKEKKQTNKGPGRKKKAVLVDEEDGEDFSDVFGLEKKAVKPKRKPGTANVRRNAIIQEEEETEESGNDAPLPVPKAKPRLAPKLAKGKPKAKSTDAIVQSKTVKSAINQPSNRPEFRYGKSAPSSMVSRPTSSQLALSDSSEETFFVSPPAIRNSPSISSASTSRSESTLLSQSTHLSPISKALAQCDIDISSLPISSSPKDKAQPARPRPFPMSFSDDEDTCDGVANGSPARRPGHSFSPKNSRARTASYSDSSREANLRKSPRKSASHVSPRSQRTPSYRTEEEESDDNIDRPGSPSPTPTRNKQNTFIKFAQLKAKPTSAVLFNANGARSGSKVLELIDISSDSDGPPPSKAYVQPLLFAQSRSKSVTHDKKSQGKGDLRTANTSTWDKDVIDLT